MFQSPIHALKPSDPPLPYLTLQDQAALRKEFDQLLNTISKPPAELDLGMTKDEIKKLKDAAFGPLTFWVTETRPIQVRESGGVTAS